AVYHVEESTDGEKLDPQKLTIEALRELEDETGEYFNSDDETDLVIPARPEFVRGKPSLLPRLALLSTLSVGFFGAMLLIQPQWREKSSAQPALNGDIPSMRVYLSDPRNQTYRAEIEAKLRAYHIAAATRLEQQPGLGLKALASLVKVLGQEKQAIASLQVQCDKTLEPQKQRLEQQLADSLSTVAGRELLGFAKPPEGEPAHVELVQKPSVNAMMTSWEFRVRTTLSAAPTVVQLQVPAQFPDEIFVALWKGLAGGPPPNVAAPVPIDGDF
ncbi:MAG: hypothetical protein ACRCZF_22825, partial [Gemmataceae bacterium]